MSNINTIGRDLLPMAVACVLAASLLDGCGSGNGSSAPTATTGTVTIIHQSQSPLLAQATQVGPVPPGTTRVSFTGLDAASSVRYGPVTFPHAPSHVLTEVPIAVVLIRVEYRSQKGQVLASAGVPVKVVAGGMTSASVSSSDPVLTVEMINDSDTGDSNVFVLLTGAGTVNGIPFVTGGSGSSAMLTSITASGSLTSPYTGITRPIYPFTVTTLTSGRLLVSYANPISITNGAAPTNIGVPFRWDKIEFGFPGSGADLTSLDFFGIPMQFDYLDVNGTVLTTMTYYTSTPTLLNSLQSLSSSCMPAAFQRTDGTTGWTPNEGLATFARVLGPQTIAALTGSPLTVTPTLPSGCPTQIPQTTGSPSPFPSFSSYLTSLVGGAPFTVTGSAGACNCPRLRTPTMEPSTVTAWGGIPSHYREQCRAPPPDAIRRILPNHCRLIYPSPCRCRPVSSTTTSMGRPLLPSPSTACQTISCPTSRTAPMPTLPVISSRR